MYQRVRARVSRKTRLQAFFENFAQLELQRVHVPDAGRARRHPLCLLFFELQKIEVESTVRNFFGAREPLLRNGEQRKTRRKRQRFLCASEYHVDAEHVHFDFHR